jgi:predicted ATP-binding protein involved in virulence
MKILNFEGRGMHGYINIQISMKPDLTFLTGINGSGKTTAVRAIVAVLTPSLRDLANTVYESLHVTIEHDDELFTVSSFRTDEEITLSCTGASGFLTVPVLRHEAYEPRSRFNEREHDFYREQEAINARHEVFGILDTLPTPMFLDLERRQQAGVRRRRVERPLREAALATPLSGSVLDSLSDAQALAENNYRTFLARRAQLTDQLKHKIILTAFESSIHGDGIGRALLPPKELLRDMERNEAVLNASLGQIGLAEEQIDSVVRPFLSRVREIGRQLPTEKRLQAILAKGIDDDTLSFLRAWSAIQPQVTQINRLLELIADYNRELSASSQQIDRFTESVNSFLCDSGKEIIFDETGRVLVQMAESIGPRPISALSSGERQLVMILTHLAFNRQARWANALIIDEPELSLHLRWQEQFVDAVMQARPDIQLILATHSPSIIKGRISNCVEVQWSQSE